MIGDTDPNREAPDLDALETWLHDRRDDAADRAAQAMDEMRVLTEMIEQVREARTWPRRNHPSLRPVPND